MHVITENNQNQNSLHTSPTSSDSRVNCNEKVVIYENGLQNINLSITKNQSLKNNINNNTISNEQNGDNNDDNHRNNGQYEKKENYAEAERVKCGSENSDSVVDDDKSLSSTVSSLHNDKISIISIDDEIDSSVIDSDEDFDDQDEIPIGGDDYIVKQIDEHLNAQVKNDGVIVINQKYDGAPSTIRTDGISNGLIGEKPKIGSIAVQNSTDITFGNKIFYQGPVRIKQFVLEKKNESTTTTTTEENGKENLAFDGEGNADKSQRYNIENELNSGYVPNKRYFNTRVAAISGAVILIALGICALVLTIQAYANKSSYTNTDGSILRIVTRDEWVAQPPMTELDNLELPTFRVIIAHTATEGCNTQAACTFRVRFIQTFHIESRNFDDIAYNFLVGGDGSVYEGRGWDKQGAHTKGYNRGSICVAFIGTFIQIEPPEKQLKAAKLIIQEGVRLGKLKPDYKLYGHRQLLATESPGEALYKIIQTWSHWTNEL